MNHSDKRNQYRIYMQLKFEKYQGTGNDFVILDHFHQELPSLNPAQIRRLCHRQFGIGADGLMILSRKEGYDFEMKYYNSDGAESSMCGNGGRCLVKYAQQAGLHNTTYRFWAIDGEHEAEIDMNGSVRLKMKDVTEVAYFNNHMVLNTGSPHFVKLTQHVAEVDVVATGRDIRYSTTFAAEGINVNFVEPINEDSIYVRTYERGVEDETLSCGTGVTAAALMCAHNEKGFNTVEVKTPGGNLRVEYDKIDDQHFENIWLCGPATHVFSGIIELGNGQLH